jgi:hypothetical protein
MSLASWLATNFARSPGDDRNRAAKPPIVISEADLIAAVADEFFGRRTPMRLFTPYTKAGRCRNGNESDHGRVVHLVQDNGKSLCGTEPEGSSAGWSTCPSEKATCPRCLKSKKRLADWPPYTPEDIAEFTSRTSEGT